MTDSTLLTSLRQSRLLWIAIACSGAAAHAQSPGASSFLGSSGYAPSAVSLPNAPEPGNVHTPATPIVRAVMPPAEQPFVLPRNFHIAPAATSSDTPEKISYYLSSTWSVRNLIEAMLIAGIPNISSAPVVPRGAFGGEDGFNAYSNAIQTWGSQNETVLRYHARRFEVGLTTAETRDLASNLALPLLLHQQAQYIPAPADAAFSDRMANAAESIVVTRNDDGMLVPNYSKLGGTVIAAFVGKSLADTLGAPELNTGHFVEKYVGYSLLGDLATNTAHELVRAARGPETGMYEMHGRATEDSYYPLSIGGKTIYWLHSTYTLRNFLTAGFIASIPAIPKRPLEPEPGEPSTWGNYPNFGAADFAYGDAMFSWKDTVEDKSRQFGRRFGGGLSEVETQDLLQNFVIPVAFDMDPRYIPLGSGYSAGQRAAHAFSSLVVGHTDSGNHMVNLPVLGGTVGAAFAAKEYYYPQIGAPELGTTSVLMRTISLNLAADGIYNVLSEFFGHRSY